MLNISGLTTTFTAGAGRAGRSRRRRAGAEVLGAFNAASQMALLYPPGIDELMRREAEIGRRRAGSGGDPH